MRVLYTIVPATWVALAIGAVCSCGNNPSTAEMDAGAVAPCAARCNIRIPVDQFFPGQDAAGVNGVARSAGQVAVDGTDLYFVVNVVDGLDGALASLSGVQRVSLGGGSPQLVVASPNPVALRLTPTLVIFTDDGPGTPPGVFAVSIDGGGASLLATTSPPTSHLIATDGREVFFSDTQGTKAVALSGGAVRTVTSVRGDVGVVGMNVVVADYDGGSLLEIPIDGHDAGVTIVPGQNHPSSPIACGSSVCWVDTAPTMCDPPFTNTSSAQVMTVGADGQTKSIVASCDVLPDFIWSTVVSDGTDVFLVAGDDVVAAPIGGGQTMPIMGGTAYWAAVDSCCVYTSDLVGIEAVRRPDESTVGGSDAGAPPDATIGD